jgi:hypothetical protein
MFKLINPFVSLRSSTRACQLIGVLELAASLIAALTCSASATPPDSCDWTGS